MFGPLSRDLGQIALIFYFEELSESSRKLYANVSQAADESEQPGAGVGAAADGDVIDAEFKEEK